MLGCKQNEKDSINNAPGKVAIDFLQNVKSKRFGEALEKILPRKRQDTKYRKFLLESMKKLNTYMKINGIESFKIESTEFIDKLKRKADVSIILSYKKPIDKKGGKKSILYFQLVVKDTKWRIFATPFELYGDNSG